MKLSAHLAVDHELEIAGADDGQPRHGFALRDDLLTGPEEPHRRPVRDQRAHAIVESLTERTHRGAGERLVTIRDRAELLRNPGASLEQVFEIGALPHCYFRASRVGDRAERDPLGQISLREYGLTRRRAATRRL